MTDPRSGRGPGVSLERVDGPAKLSGRCRYLPDLRVPGMLYACQVTSPHAHARILGIDAGAARARPGVHAVLTAADVPGENRIGAVIDDGQPLLAEGSARYAGECLAVVAAETEALAREAAALVAARLEPLPALLDLEAAMAAADAGINARGPVAAEARVTKGDAARALAGADAVVEGTFRTAPQEHFYLEPQGALARPEADGGVTVLGSLQCPFYVQTAVARTAGLPLSKVRVIQTPTGGAFGGKEDLPNEICGRAALLALATGRPVRLVLERREDLAATSKRHPFLIHGRLGATRDGRLLALDLRQDAEAGAWASLSAPVMYRAAVQGAGPYEIPHVRVETRAWYTHHPPNGAFRGFGGPQAAFAHERLVDMMAGALDMDPVELRRRNLLRPGGRTATGHRVEEGVGALETLERCAAAARAGEDAVAPPTADANRWLLATGYASVVYGNCLGKAGWHLDGAGAYLQVHRDGSVSCAVGLIEMGQGAETVITQFVAEALGVPPERVHLLPVDTALVPDCGPTVASRNVIMSGNAILDAGRRLRGRLAALAAERLGGEAADIRFAAGRVAGPRGEMAFDELADEAWRRNLNLAAEGWWHVPPLDFDVATGRGEAYFAYSFATQAARVAVDRLTGQVRLLKVWAAHDVGRAVNPAGIEAQVEGGVAQGLGLAVTERLVRADGRTLTDNLSTYTIPTSVEAPDVETLVVEAPHPLGPGGAKSLGEPALIPTAAAIANAVSRAVGAPVDALPMDPERVLALVEQGHHGQDPLF
ncbi:MAG: xanthine dehydrogenase family protein [Candidatus Krumholzibacteriota bacterium]|nr:xanthine dehydrogenase family protein [Candidatus Krumholzibacteriota bacterium]